MKGVRDRFPRAKIFRTKTLSDGRLFHLLSSGEGVTPFFAVSDGEKAPAELSDMTGRFFDGVPAFPVTNGCLLLASARGKGRTDPESAEKRLARMLMLPDVKDIVEDARVTDEASFRDRILIPALPRFKARADAVLAEMLGDEDYEDEKAVACDPVEAQRVREVLRRFEDGNPAPFVAIVEENAPFTLARMKENGIPRTTEDIYRLVVARCFVPGRIPERSGGMLTFRTNS